MFRGSAAFVVLAALALAGYVTSNYVSADLLAQTLSASCNATPISLVCRYDPARAFDPQNYGLLAAFVTASFLYALLFLRRNIVYCFALLTFGLFVFTIGFDFIFQRMVFNEEKIINDSWNTLSVVILFSFIALFSLCIRRPISLIRAIYGIAVSYGAKIVCLIPLYISVSHFMGATSLLLLFLYYTIGVFNIHLMGLSVLGSNIAPLDRRTARVSDATPTS